MSTQMLLFAEKPSATTPKNATLERGIKEVSTKLSILLDASNGPKYLRKLVLDLAIRGRLGTSAAKDEPAVSLLRRLDAHGTESGLIGPFDLPPTWAWTRFSSVATIDSNLVDPAKYPELPHVAPDSIEKGTGRLIGYRTIREDGVISSKHRFFPQQILYSKIRPNLSKVILVDFEGLCSADMYPLTAKIDADYLKIFMLTPAFLTQVVKDDNRLAMPKVNQQQLNAVLIAVPPLPEQRRIVRKVDGLMALCDELEAKQAKKREVGDRLTKAALGALTSAEGPEEFEAAWKRVAENFEELLDRPEQVTELRQALIDILTSGRLFSNHEQLWPRFPLDDFVHDTRYGTSKKCDRDSSLTPVLRIPNVVSGKLLLDDLKYAEFSEHELEVLRLHPGDLLIVRSNGSKELVGRACVVEPSARGFAYAGYLVRIRVKQDRVLPKWIQLSLLSSNVRRQIESPIRTTSGVHNINTKELLSLEVTVPSINEQKNALIYIARLSKLCDDLEAKLRVRDMKAVELADALASEVMA